MSIIESANSDFADQFGASVSISGNTVAVGVRGEDSNASTINGDQTNNGLNASGAVLVFVGDAGGWTQQAI
ncbi:MAG: hypothetical protein ACI8TQ_001189 [Planctomycetota bacterium]|jgi:hypothetical protein